jgi:replicative DNA helicase
MVTVRTPPHDIEAEESLLGAMLLSGDATAAGIDMVDGADFYQPKHGHIFHAIAALYGRGDPIDSVTVVDELRSLSLLDAVGDPSIFITLQANTPSIANARHYAQIVVRHAIARRIAEISSDAMDQVFAWGDPFNLVDDLRTQLDAIDMPILNGVQKARTLDEIIENADQDSPWVLPGLVRVDWRVVVIGTEGSGKSVTLRQVAACAAQGVHPFRPTRCEPVRVLLIDLENPAQAIAETGAQIVRMLRRVVGDAYETKNLRVLERPDGIDLQTRRDRAELERELTIHRPDMVMIGPGYRMLKRHIRGGERESHEEVTDAAFEVLDDLRTRHNFGLMIEHHAPKGRTGQARELVPYGSQRWLAWPDLGLTLEPDRRDSWKYLVGRFRGDRLLNDWPSELHRSDLMRPGASNGWPWEGRWSAGMNVALGMGVESPPPADWREEPF